jgi:PTS system N-acetylglucosamine-specific IIC component
MATATGERAATVRGGGFERVLGPLQNLGRSLMLPIAVMPAAALLLRLGQPDLLDLPWMAAAGDAVFSNLAMIFAVGIAFGLAGGEGAAALAGLVGYLVFQGVFEALIPQVDGEPDPNVNMGVLSGIIVGLVAAALYKRYSDIRLPDYLAFFGGKRFVPIATAVACLALGAFFGLVWPFVQIGVNAVGEAIVGLGALGTGLYGFFNRLLIPIGLHHVLNTYVWFQLGTFEGPDGPVNGEITRYFAGDPNAGLFLAGFFPIMMFGLPAACLAMIRHARLPKVAAGILLSAAFASVLTGVTEPIEFSFMFVAPLLYLVHAVLTGTALAVATLLDIHIGFGFSAGLIDYVLNFSKDNTTRPLLLLGVGLVYFVIYYVVFSFFIKRFDLATPGRGEASTGLSSDWILPESQRGPRPGEEEPATAPAADRDPDDVLAENVLAALGGRENVGSVEGCITRLRLSVQDSEQINDARLKTLGAAGVVKRGRVAQVVMGTQSDRIAARINRLLKERVPEQAPDATLPPAASVTEGRDRDDVLAEDVLATRILAPISGEAVPLSEVPDEVFATGVAGQGVAIVPSGSGEAVAPVSGTLVKLFEGGHAFGIETADGIEMIVHIGLDTVEMDGGGFEKLAAEEDEVEAGQPIVRFDLEAIRAAGYDPVTPVVVTNPDEHPVSGQATGQISAGDFLFEAG